MKKNQPDIPSWNRLESSLLNCRLCPRLVSWREQVSAQKRRAYLAETYWGRPVPGFGDRLARVLVVGLAPGAHGSNRTGRMFTGDASGDFLFPALYQNGFANQPQATSREDGLTLQDLFISAVCRCAPPDNKPSPGEIQNCMRYLSSEMDLLSNLEGIVCLGKIGFDHSIRHLVPSAGLRKKYHFRHLAYYPADALIPFWVLASYHPSRQNTQTGRLTQEMFTAVWHRVRKLLNNTSL